MSSSRAFAWIVWLIASIFYAYQYILRVMPNIMMNDIMQQFHIDAAAFGQFSGVYYLGYSLMHLPVGIMLDRFGPKKVLPLCMLMTVVGLTPLMISDYWLYPIVGRTLIGMGSSAAILGVFKVIRLTFSEKHFTRMLSFSVAIGLIGAIYGGGPVDYMVQTMGYQKVIGFFAILGVALAITTFIIVPPIKKYKSKSIMGDIKAVFSNKKVMMICLLAGMMLGPMEGFADAWGTAFLKENYALEGLLAASLPSAIFVGMCFGSPILSLIAEKTNSYFGTIIASAIIMAVVFYGLLLHLLHVDYLTVLFMIVGMCCAYQIIAIYKASTYVKEQLVGLTTAAANMIIMVFGYLFHSLIGYIVNALGGAHDAKALVWGLVIIPIGLTIGAVGFSYIASHEHKARKRKTQSLHPIFDAHITPS